MRWGIVFVALAGCSATPSKPEDLGAPHDAAAHHDLAGRDLALPDLAAADLTVADAAEDDLAGGDLATDDFSSTEDAAGGCAMACPYGCYQGQCVAQALGDLTRPVATVTGTGVTVQLIGGTAPTTSTVSITTQTWPAGAAEAVHLVTSLNDPNFHNPIDTLMQFDRNVGPNQQWIVMVPAQPTGTHVFWYVRAVGWDGTMLVQNNFNQNWDYLVQ
jgi:hypothetical protein